MQRPMFLTRRKAQKVHQAALRVLAETGIHLDHEEAVDLCLRAGARRDEDGRILFAEGMVANALAAAPSKIRIYDRLGKPAMDLAAGRTYFGPGSDALYNVDRETGRLRFSTLGDVADNVRLVPLAQIEAALTMGATRFEMIRLVLAQSARPAMLDTLRITMGWAWTYLVVAELVAANSGLGYAILKAQRYLKTDTIFGGIILIGVIGLVMDQGFRWLHRRLYPWAHTRG